MRFRRFGTSDLVVSEVGIGTWTLVSDWWGRSDDPKAMLHAALDAGINFIDTAPVYGEEGAGESILRDLLRARDDIVLTTKVGYDITAERRFPGQSERPHDWRPESVHAQCDASLLRLGIDHIDLYQLHNTRIEPILADDLWDALEELQRLGKVRELGVALGPAIGWVEEGNRAVDERPITSLQTVFNILEQEPGLTFAKRPRVQRGEVGLIARVPHASDTLSGRVTPDTVFDPKDHRSHRNRDNMLDNFEKAETLSFLWEPETGRTIGQAAIAGILANPAFTCVLPTVLTIEDVVEYAASSDLPMTADEKSAVDGLWSRNFDHEDRYVMPLKSSVTSG
jgi:aryl-alcohol dehydrogenase-like predicted oxidoreductase